MSAVTTSAFDRVVDMLGRTEYVVYVPKADVGRLREKGAPRTATNVLGEHQGWTEQFPNREIDESRVDMPAVNLPVSNDMMALTVLSLSLLPVP